MSSVESGETRPMIDAMVGKYRTRTWLRGHLPLRLGWLSPKGTDCGNHEWYRQNETTWACYHCEVTTHSEPWSLIDTAQLALAALQTTIEHSHLHPLGPEEVATVRRLTREAEEAVHQLAESLDGADSDRRVADALEALRAPRPRRESQVSSGR